MGIALSSGSYALWSRLSFNLFRKFPLKRGVVAESGMMKVFLAFESNLCTAVFKSFFTVLFYYLNFAVSRVNTEAAVSGAFSFWSPGIYRLV